MTKNVQSGVGALTWTGKYDGPQGAIAKARAAFRKDPATKLIPFASTLYSAHRSYRQRGRFLSARRCLSELGDLISRLLIRARSKDLSADEIDVLSSLLAYWGKDPERLNASAAWTTARDLLLKGIHIAPATPGSHTEALLRLTLVWVSAPFSEGAEKHLDRVRAIAPLIEDPNQKTRVLRRLGIAYLRRLDLVQAGRWLIRARRVPGASADAKAKTKILGFI